MNPTDKASLSIVGVSLVLIILVGFFFQEKGIFGIQNSSSYLIVTISIEDNASGETNIVIYEDDGENKDHGSDEHEITNGSCHGCQRAHNCINQFCQFACHIAIGRLHILEKLRHS